MSEGNRVKSLLVTGPEGAVMEFWTPLAGRLNFMVRNHATTHFTLWNDPPALDAVIEVAKQAGVSVQEVVGAGKDETYITLHEAAAGLWLPPRRRPRP